MFYQYNHLGYSNYFKIEQGTNFNFPLHLHQCFEIITLLEGEMDITVDNQVFSLSKNEALLIFPNQIHSLSTVASKHVLCIFSPKLVQYFSSKHSGSIPCNNKFYPDKHLIDMLIDLVPNSNTTQKKGVLYSLCGQFEETAQYKPKMSDDEGILYQIFSFVEENFKQDCSLSNLAEATGYNYSYLSRYFKNTVGMSFNSYVIHSRLSRACYLMENTEMPIIECALESGFTSLRSFNRNFKDYYRITPVEYRNNSAKHLLYDDTLSIKNV